MRLRLARPRETASLQQIEKAARVRYLSIADLAFVADAPPINAERLANGTVTLAAHGRRIAGFILAQPLDGMSYIANISVAPEHSGFGVGAALVAAADEQAAAAGLSALVLATFKEPRWNGPWFRRLGFAPIPDHRIGPGLRAILDRHATFLDMETRETLWRPIIDRA